MNFEYVVFDLDGTLTDSGPGITKSVQYALRKFGVDEPDLAKLRVFVGPPLFESFMKYYGFPENQCDALVEAYREYYNVKGMFENSVYPGIPELLNKLNGAGKKCCIATTKPDKPAKHVLEHFDLIRYFSHVSCGGDSLQGGNKTVVLERLFRECGEENKKNAVMIGDRSHDIVGAKNNGLYSVGVLYGYGTETELKAAEADRIVETVSGLSDFLTEEK